MGNANATYWAMAPIEKIAPIAMGDANMSKPRRAPIVRTNLFAV